MDKTKGMIFPGERIGIIGGGQLGRMMALSAKRMGYFVTVLDPDADSPCAQVADHKIVADYNDAAALGRLADICRVVTYEFENIDVKAVEALELNNYLVRPSSRLLKLKQNRLFEKETLKQMRIPVPEFRKVASEEDLDQAAESIGFPAVLKTTYGGYDGKGQGIVNDASEAYEFFKKLGSPLLIWEKKVPFVKELGIVAARNSGGEFTAYPVTENIHSFNILNKTIAPADIPKDVKFKAMRIARRVAEAFDLIGVFCVEFFLLENGNLLINEIAPRPHNSGHYTIEASLTSQFEQHIRAICGLPLGSAVLRSPAVMVNILGNNKGNNLKGLEKLLDLPGVSLHMYGKKNNGPRRKMGHFTVLENQAKTAIRVANSAAKMLRWD